MLIFRCTDLPAFRFRVAQNFGVMKKQCVKQNVGADDKMSAGLFGVFIFFL